MILGTMTFGPHAQVTNAKELVLEFHRLGGRVLDTARVYQYGETEQLLGQVLAELPPAVAGSLEVHTKAHPMLGKLDRDGVRRQLEASLAALRLPRVHIFYLHAPNHDAVKFEDTLQACNELYEEGKFIELGLSNFASWDVVRAHYLCLKNGWKAPTVYQGVYNALNRSLDHELLPMARSFGMRVVVYNPLCGGLLTGKYDEDKDLPTKGRFSAEFDLVPNNASQEEYKWKGQAHLMYRARYWNASTFAAVHRIKLAVDKEAAALTMTQAALRWCAHHSSLRPDLGDAVIFGASSVQQVAENATSLAGGAAAAALPPSLVEAINTAADKSGVVPEAYFRGYDAVPGRAYAYLGKF